MQAQNGMPTMPTNIPLREEMLETAAIIPLKFWVEYTTVIIPASKDEPEHTERRAHEWVHWAKKGVSIPATVVDKVARLRKDPCIWRALEPYYTNWKQGGTTTVPPGQTPLEAWGGITRDEIEALRPYRILSVEDFATMNDQVMGKIPFPDIGARRQHAKKFLDTQKTAEEVKALMGDENAKLKAQLEEMQKVLMSMQADSKPSTAKGKRAHAEAAA